MRKGIAVFLLASLVFFASAQASTVRLATSWDGGAARLSTPKIEPREGGFLVEVLDGTGRVTGSASFDSGFRPTHYAPVEMSVKRLGTERLSIGGRSMDAARFEMSLSSGFLKLFWPYASRYWFSTDDMRFLAYEGRDRRGRTVRVEAVE